MIHRSMLPDIVLHVKIRRPAFTHCRLGDRFRTMAQDLLQVHEEALSFMTDVIHNIPDDAWNAQSPCAEWTVRDVVNHITNENLWAEPLMDGQTVEQVGDRFDGD